MRFTKAFGLSSAFLLVLPVAGASCKPHVDAAGTAAVAALTDAPEVPPPTGDRPPRLAVVELEVREQVLPLADGVQYTFWTFGGHVPGKFIRVAQGDSVEVHLKNHPNNKLPHNIDLHAVTGPGGGAASSFAAPGQESQFTFKALNPGLYVYHCATPPVGMHVANGMYGLILVEPRGGLPRVDREYYVMQGDFYTTGPHGAPGLQTFDEEKAIAEKPSYVVFNGSEGALMGDRALTARVGETVRLFVGNGGPNLTSSFHVIGEIFDRVYPEGGTKVQQNVQTTSVPPGGAAIVELKVEVPGAYALVDHALFRAFNKGALGQLKVVGPDAPDVYSGPQQPRPVADLKARWFGPTNAPKTAQPTLASAIPAEPADPHENPHVTQGRNTFRMTCAACHQMTGLGIPHTFPPLASSDFLAADKQRAIAIVLYGLTTPVTVNGETYHSAMPPQMLSDEKTADVLTYVRSSFGNKLDAVSAAEVAKVRAEGALALAPRTN